LLILFLLWGYADRWYEAHLVDEKRAEVSSAMHVNGNSLVIAINRRMAMITGLKVFILTGNDLGNTLSRDTFDKFAAGLYAGTKEIRAIQALPGGVVSFVYPLAGNEQSLGHDLLHDSRPAVSEDVKRTVRTREIALSNPYELRQGGLGVVERLAVYKSDDTLWGLVVIVLDIPPLLDAAGITLPGSKIELSLRDKSRKVFYGREEVFLTEPVIKRIELPDGYWELAGIPKEGWGLSIQDSLILFRGVSLSIVLMLSSIVYLTANRQASLKMAVRQRTAELNFELLERKQAVEELRITNEELLAINRIITTTTTNNTGVNEVLEKVMDEALNITGLEGGTICMLTPDGTLHLAAHRETSDETIRDLTENIVKIGDCLCGECARDHNPLILKDREAVLEYATREATRGEDIRFHAAFPLLMGGRCLGVLCVFTRTDFKPTDRSLKLLETVTSQIAIAVDHARMLEEITHHAKNLENTVRERTAELKRNQTALLSIVEDLRLMTEELKVANDRLQELDRLKSMFIASMSHELRTPLNSIIGFTAIILQGMTGEINEEQRDQLQRVSKAGKHLLALITDVIDVSKIETGKIDAYIEEFPLDALLNDALSNLKLQIKEKGLEIEVGTTPEKIFLKTDRKRLLQCILNYLSNAVKFTEKGQVTLLAEEKGGTIELKVTDTGIGIKEEDLPMLFQSFVRLESPLKMTVSGTGLGLYLTKKLVTEVLGGEVSVTSSYGKGSTFALRIPKERLTGVEDTACKRRS
jgi:signal transduction histidine kinase/sensor domain CHASE-containing protein